MTGWPTERLEDCCTLMMGQAPAGSSYNFDRIGWPLIAGAGDFGSDRPKAKKYTTEPSRLSAPGDIILGIRATIGVKVLADDVYALGRGVAGITPGADIDGRFLWHWLTSVRSVIEAKGKGATFPQVNRSDIGELELSVPPLPEQRRIAGILDRADELRAQRRSALALLDTLPQSIFSMMFGGGGYDRTRLGEVADVQGGLQVSRSRSSLPVEVPYLRVANVHRNRLDLTQIKSINVSQPELNRTRLRSGDILVVEGHGNPLEIGRMAIWNGAIEPCVHQNHLIRVRCTNRLSPVFTAQYLNSANGRRHLLRAGKTTSGLNTITTTDVKSAPIPVPPLPLQQEFAQRVEAVERLNVVAPKVPGRT